MTQGRTHVPSIEGHAVLLYYTIIRLGAGENNNPLRVTVLYQAVSFEKSGSMAFQTLKRRHTCSVYRLREEIQLQQFVGI